jgi:hypothetical protein
MISGNVLKVPVKDSVGKSTVTGSCVMRFGHPAQQLPIDITHPKK